jgi:hypothetical protein
LEWRLAMAVHRRWLVLVFVLLAFLCCTAFIAGTIPVNTRGNRLWDANLDAMADGSVTVEEFAAYDRLAREGSPIESKMTLGVAAGCVVVMFMLLPVWAYTEPLIAMVGGKREARK